jgi:hypothetical protein
MQTARSRKHQSACIGDYARGAENIDRQTGTNWAGPMTNTHFDRLKPDVSACYIMTTYVAATAPICNCIGMQTTSDTGIFHKNGGAPSTGRRWSIGRYGSFRLRFLQSQKVPVGKLLTVTPRHGIVSQ